MCALPKPSIARGDGAWLQEESLPLFQREVRERLSPTALAFLLSRAEIFVEGGTASGRSAMGAFLGSAMMTLDLGGAGERLRPPHDEKAAQRLGSALTEDQGARRALVAHALEIARARLSAPVDLRGSELKIRVEGCRVHIDLELEGTA